MQCNAGEWRDGLQLQHSDEVAAFPFICWAPFLLCLSHTSFWLSWRPTSPHLLLLLSPPLLPVKLVHLNLLQFFLLPQRSRTEVCSSSCRQAPFLVAFCSGYLDLLLRQIQLMWCALGARGSNSAAAPRAPIPNFDEALPL